MNSSRIFQLLLSVFLIISPELLALSRSRQQASRLQAVETLQRQQLARRMALQVRLRSVRTMQKRHMHPGVIIAEYGTLIESAIAAGKFAVKIGAVLGAIIWEGNREELLAEQKKAAEAEHKKEIERKKGTHEITIAGTPGQNGTYVLISNRGNVKLPKNGQVLLDSAVRIGNYLYNVEDGQLVAFKRINLTNNYYAQIAEARWQGGGKWEAQAQSVAARGRQKLIDAVNAELEQRRQAALQAHAAAARIEIVPKPLISEEEIAQIAAAEKKAAAEQDSQDTPRIFKPTDGYNSSSGQETLNTAVWEPLGTLISIDNGDIVRLTPVPNTNEYTGVILKRAIIPGTTDTITAALYIQWTNAIKAKQAERATSAVATPTVQDGWPSDWTSEQKTNVKRAYDELHALRLQYGNLGDLATNVHVPDSYRNLDDDCKSYLRTYFRVYEERLPLPAPQVVVSTVVPETEVAAPPATIHPHGLYRAVTNVGSVLSDGQTALDEAYVDSQGRLWGVDGEGLVLFEQGIAHGLYTEDYIGTFVNDNPDMLQQAKKHKETVRAQKQQAQEEAKKRNGAGGGGPEDEKDRDKNKNKKVNWTAYDYKHMSSKLIEWKEIIKSTLRGPAKYKHGINVEELERKVWDLGIKCWENLTTGEVWKILKVEQIIGADLGIETKYVLVKMTADTIHGQPISPARVAELLKK